MICPAKTVTVTWYSKGEVSALGAGANTTGMVIDTTWGQGYILREMLDYSAMPVNA